MALVGYVAAPGCSVQKPGSRHDGPARYLSETDPYLVEDASPSGQRMTQRERRGEVRKVSPAELAKAIKARDEDRVKADAAAKAEEERGKAALAKKQAAGAQAAKPAGAPAGGKDGKAVTDG